MTQLNKKFVIEVEMKEKWVPYFMSMLEEMERLGNEGRGKVVGIYSGGELDFKPKFNVDFEYETKEPEQWNHISIYDGTEK